MKEMLLKPLTQNRQWELYQTRVKSNSIDNAIKCMLIKSIWDLKKSIWDQTNCINQKQYKELTH